MLTPGQFRAAHAANPSQCCTDCLGWCVSLGGDGISRIERCDGCWHFYDDSVSDDDAAALPRSSRGPCSGSAGGSVVIYEAVFEACAALLRGQILRGSEADLCRGKGAWGVIDCSQALGAFDARSEAWCGRDGIPSRMSQEDAEQWARRLSGSSQIGTTYSAIEIPERPRLVMAGRHCAATDPALRFECVDWSNGPADVVAVGSAFDAAAAFVALVGERLTYAAIYSQEAA